VTRRLGRRRKQPLNHLKKMRRWCTFKEDARAHSQEN